MEGSDQVTLETPQGGTKMLPWALFGGHHNGQGQGPRWPRTVESGTGETSADQGVTVLTTSLTSAVTMTVQNRHQSVS